MESVGQQELDFDAKPLPKAVGTAALKQENWQPLRESLEATNPILGKLAGSIVEQTTRGLKPKTAKIIGDSFFRALLTLEESSHPTMSVLLTDRAENLLLTLDSVSRNHSLGGLDMASEPDSMYIPELLAYFKTSREGLDNIKENSARKRPRLYGKAKLHFAAGVGHKLIEESGLIDSEDNDNMTSHDFIKFVQKYYVSPDAESQRAKFRRRLNKYRPKS